MKYLRAILLVLLTLAFFGLSIAGVAVFFFWLRGRGQPVKVFGPIPSTLAICLLPFAPYALGKAMSRCRSPEKRPDGRPSYMSHSFRK
jgi:hypothetical protein